MRLLKTINLPGGNTQVNIHKNHGDIFNFLAPKVSFSSSSLAEAVAAVQRSLVTGIERFKC